MNFTRSYNQLVVLKKSCNWIYEKQNPKYDGKKLNQKLWLAKYPFLENQ